MITYQLSARQLQQIADIIREHQGKNNAVFSGDIAKWIGLREKPWDAHVKIRALILQTAKVYGLAVGASGDGYFLIQTQSELESYVASLNRRKAQLTSRIELTIANFRYTNQQKTLEVCP